MVIRRSRRRSYASRRRAAARATSRRGNGFFSNLFKSASKTELKIELETKIAREIWAIIYITLAILTYLSLGGGIGAFGEWWVASFRGMFGIGINFVPAIFFVVGVVMLSSANVVFNFTRVLGISLLVASALGIVHLAVPQEEMLSHAAEYGGLTGFVTSVFFRAAFADTGAKILLFALFLISSLLTFGVSFRELLGSVISQVTGKPIEKSEEEVEEKKTTGFKVHDFLATEKNKSAVKKAAKTTEKEAEKAEPPAKDNFRINEPGKVKLVSEFKPQPSKVSDADWTPPSLDLLDPASEKATYDEAALRKKAEVIQQKLSKFGIDVTMQDVNIGPAVMQYTLKPAEGVKLSKIMNLKHDLALALAAKSLRIEAPIPGKSLVGIEIPTANRTIVHLKELLLSDAFSKIKSNMRIVLGRDVAGQAMVADLAEMPHLLVAGATGSGKSVGINAFLLSLIYQNSPNDLRLILVDPKRVELVPYNGIPHLLTPVINDPEKTVSALKWAVGEMTKRYIELSKAKVRNIKEFNAKHPPEKMPYIVIVIDELADLMMVAQKEVEGCIMRLAQMARAVGIHLILATQRPSVNVITGVIKANIPTRLSFAVTSGVDSKTILDGIGAEDLLGQGDMLFIPPGASKPVRIQGAFISTDEVRRVTNSIKLDLEEEPTYDTSITDAQHDVALPGVKRESTSGAPGSVGSDEYILQQAARVVVETGKASASLLQRRLSLGYARAARILDQLEERGFVGPSDGAKPRAIYVTAEKLAQLESGGGVDNETAAKLEVARQLDEMDRGRGER
jgi:S-DNA-T family DNA segregation ATPase FtsK/SpoIIIE